MEEGEWFEKQTDISVLDDPSGIGRTSRDPVWSCQLLFICRRVGEGRSCSSFFLQGGKPDVQSCRSGSNRDLTSTGWRWRSPCWFSAHFLLALLEWCSPGIHLSKLIFNSASPPCYCQMSSIGGIYLGICLCRILIPWLWTGYLLLVLWRDGYLWIAEK